jgi:hypothetical protein
MSLMMGVPGAANDGLAAPPRIISDERYRLPLPSYIEVDEGALALLDSLFPAVRPPYKPRPRQILVQERLPRLRQGSILLPDTVRDADALTMNIARVVALGTGCNSDDVTGQPFDEDDCLKVGEFVRIPKFGPDRPREGGTVVWRALPTEQITLVITDIDAILR